MNQNNYFRTAIQLAICESFDFMDNYQEWGLRKKNCKDIGIDDETNLLRFKEDDDVKVRYCN